MGDQFIDFWKNKITTSQYFRYDKETDYCFCRVEDCTASIKGKPGKLLDKHMLDQHKRTYLFYTSEKFETFNTNNVKVENQTITEKIQDALVELVIKNGRTFDYFDDSGFLKIINTLMNTLPENERFDVSTFSVKDIISEKVKKFVKAEITGQILHVKIDTVKFEQKFFISVHVQFYRENCVILRTLMVKKIDNISQGAIEEIVNQTLKNYDIPSENIFSLSIDDGTDILFRKSENPMVKLEPRSPKLLDCLLEINHSSTAKCITNSYNEVVYEVLERYNDRFIKSIIILRNQAILLGISERSLDWMNGITKSSLNENPYWLLIIDLFAKIYSNERFIELEVKGPDWHWLRLIFDCLIWIKNFIDQLLERDHSPSEFFVEWCICKTGLADCKSDIAEELLRCMSAKEEKKLLQDDMLLASIYLDPRFKHLLPIEKIPQAIETIQKLWQKISILKKETQMVNHSLQKINRSDNSTQRDCLLDNLLETAEIVHEMQMAVDILPLLDNFRRLPRVDRNKNLFEYWEENKITQPILYALARIIHSIPASRFSLNKFFYGVRGIVDSLKFDFDEEVEKNFICVPSSFDSTMLVFDKRIFL